MWYSWNIYGSQMILTYDFVGLRWTLTLVWTLVRRTSWLLLVWSLVAMVLIDWLIDWYAMVSVLPGLIVVSALSAVWLRKRTGFNVFDPPKSSYCILIRLTSVSIPLSGVTGWIHASCGKAQPLLLDSMSNHMDCRRSRMHMDGWVFL